MLNGLWAAVLGFITLLCGFLFKRNQSLTKDNQCLKEESIVKEKVLNIQEKVLNVTVITDVNADLNTNLERLSEYGDGQTSKN